MIDKEKTLRNQFMNEFGKILPSDFIPQFRDTTPVVKLEGAGKEYDLPDIEDLEDDLIDPVLEPQP